MFRCPFWSRLCDTSFDEIMKAMRRSMFWASVDMWWGNMATSLNSHIPSDVMTTDLLEMLHTGPLKKYVCILFFNFSFKSRLLFRFLNTAMTVMQFLIHSKSTEECFFSSFMLRLLLQVSVNMTKRDPTATKLWIRAKYCSCWVRNICVVTLTQFTSLFTATKSFDQN